MNDLVSVFRYAQDEFTRRVSKIGAEQWGAPTPDDEWTVTDLVGHLVDEHRWVPPLLGGHHLGAAAQIVDAAKRAFAGPPAEAWEAAALASLRAVTEPGALDRDVDLSAGPTPVPGYLDEMIFDLTVHAWDLGMAVSVREPLPDVLVQRALRTASAFGHTAESALFKPPVEVGDDASDEARLLALTGRHPDH